MQKRDCPPPLPPNRRLSSNDDRNTPFSQVHGMTQQRGQASIAPLSPLPMKCDDLRMYQNISRQPQGGPHSPTKHRGCYPVPPSEPVPDGYYNVSPPLALKKYPSHRTSSSSPPSLSQEEDAAFFSEFAPVLPPPIKTVSNSTSLQDGYMDSYFRLNPQQRPTMKLEGDNLVVHRLHNGGVEGEGKGRGAAVIPSKEEASMYQNLDFMSKKLLALSPLLPMCIWKTSIGTLYHRYSRNIHECVLSMAIQTQYVRVLMRDEKEERCKQGQTNNRQSNTAHPRQSLFLRKMSCLGWDSNPRHSIL